MLYSKQMTNSAVLGTTSFSLHLKACKRYEQKFHGVRFDSLHLQTLFSFEPLLCEPLCNGKQFLQYLNDVSRKFDIFPKIHFNEGVKLIDWNSQKGRWMIETSKAQYSACFVMNANGYYTKDGYLPEIFQNTEFKGRLLHSFQVDQDKLDLTNDNVILVGSGATAVTSKTSFSSNRLTYIDSGTCDPRKSEIIGFGTTLSFLRHTVSTSWFISYTDASPTQDSRRTIPLLFIGCLVA